MICPKCGKEIERVTVVSRCYQDTTLGGPDRNKTTDFSSPEVTETLEINCQECWGDIQEFIDEG